MTNEEFQSLVLKQLHSLTEGQSRIESRMNKLESKVDKLELSVETEVIDKIRVLFDGYSLRGDQIDKLQKHIDERLDSIEIDTGYLVSRVARLEKMAK
ncbi:hypothetical protein SAMN05660649_04665 [Desulfotomaculum arcticum]|uniref:Uncharacterized protein n=1 Tax=Desulfotruncus arcticus DSM 17038 TaxID=1121424 RepID=A0A1I2YWV3_9FIRM|nr:hypothetical protein [Desulfotruncus arcticus]SFH30092.1 hypothetical protein SAMN05660649_04665 [Desulfotomaculum arcticum] [Desulfotruncus arcticus DSM 17038]